MVKVRYVDITPEIAKAWLAKEINANNRPINEGRANTYAAEMRAGKWKETHEGIAFDKNGVLVDGQHRLLAIVRSGVTLHMLVSEGLEPEARLVVDSGQGRTVGQSLHMTGYDYGVRIAAGLNAVQQVFMPNRRILTRMQVVEIYDQYPEAVKLINANLSPHGEYSRALSTGACLLGAVIDADGTLKFITSFIDGIGLNAGDPALLARHVYIKRNTRGLDPRRESTILFLRCVEAALNRETLGSKVIFSENIVYRIAKRLKDDKGWFGAQARDAIVRIEEMTKKTE